VAETVRDILAANATGLSRPALLAWARLRIDPGMTDAQLDAELAALGDEVVDDDGFLRLRGAIPTSEESFEPEGWDEAPGAPASTWAADGSIPGWNASGDATSTVPTAADAPAPGTDPGRGGIPGWAASGAAWPAGAGTGDGEPMETPGSVEAPAEVQGWQSGGRGITRGQIVIALVALGVIAAAVSFQALSASSEGGENRAAEDLRVGDCIAIPEAEEFEEVLVIECTTPHAGEVFFVGDVPADRDADFPTDLGWEAFAADRCTPAFADYTGSAYEGQDVLEYSWFTPTETGWSEGDREVACILYPADLSETSQSWRGASP
jgi:hypothetical protein